MILPYKSQILWTFLALHFDCTKLHLCFHDQHFGWSQLIHNIKNHRSHFWTKPSKNGYCDMIHIAIIYSIQRRRSRRGQRGLLYPPSPYTVFGRTVNPIRIRGADYPHHNITRPPGFGRCDLFGVCPQGAFNNDVDKMSRGEGQKMLVFIHAQGKKNCPSRQAGGQKMAKFCPRSC